MDEIIVASTGEAKDSPEDLEAVEEARRILFEPGYIPRVVIESAESEGRPAPTNFDPVRDQGTHYALNNFMMYFTGAIKPVEGPTEELGGKSYTDLFHDRDEMAAELGLDINELIEFARRSRDADPYGDDSLLSFYRKVFPIFEKLVREKGYSVDALKM
jgi:hypothetical protein